MRTRELRDRLIAIQRDEPHHKLIGTLDKKGRPLPLDTICRRCPSKRKCAAASRVLGDLESSLFTKKES